MDARFTMNEVTYMLLELQIRQSQEGRQRRWLSDDYFDLILWYEADGTPYGFQLCYDKPRWERALTWTRTTGFRHEAIDCGGASAFGNVSPTLVPTRTALDPEVREKFIQRSRSAPLEIRRLVLQMLKEYQQQ